MPWTKDQRRQVIAQLAARDGAICHYCQVPLETGGRPRPGEPYALLRIIAGRSFFYGRAPIEVDHITPRSEGGGDELSNLILSCSRCNGHRRVKPYAEYVQIVEAWKRHVNWPVLLAEIYAICGEPYPPSEVPQ